MQTLARNWWLLAFCGVLDAIISAICFDHAGHGFASKGAVIFFGQIALAAGACTIAAGLWRSGEGKCWLLALNGLALATLGLVLNGIFGFKISFRTVALLIIVMAVSIGILELLISRTLRRQGRVADVWVLGLAGGTSFGFALGFIALAAHWIRIVPGSHPDLLWLGSYFGFSAISKLGLALRLQGLSPSPGTEALPPLGNPRHAH